MDIINEKIVSVRQFQREYRKIAEYVKSTKKPVYVCKFNKPELVVLDVQSLDKIVKLNIWKIKHKSNKN